MGRKWKYHSNCYGYALGTKHWLQLECFDRTSHSRVNDVAAECDLEIRERFEWLRPVHRNDMQLGKEYVAMRIAPTDFHFMKRNKTGHWRHKMGSSPVEAISQKKVFDPRGWHTSCHVYSSDIYIYEIEQQ